MPVHAWRALAQLGCRSAVPHLLDLIDRAGENDFFTEDLPRAVGMVGAPIFDQLHRRVLDRSTDIFARSVAAHAMVQLTYIYPESRERTGDLIARTVSDPTEKSPTLVALLIGDLVELDGVEWALHIKAAFEAGRVNPWDRGDWEDVQIQLGLLDARLTPPELALEEYAGMSLAEIDQRILDLLMEPPPADGDDEPDPAS